MNSRIPDHTIEEIKNRADIAGVVSEYVALKKRGKNLFGLCPFHQDKDPSFSVNPEKQIYHCFGCGAGGSVFNFLMEMEKVSFIEAVRTLAARVGVKLPEKGKEEADPNDQLYEANQLALEYYHRVLLETKTGGIARAYLQERGIGNELAQKFQLGYAPDSWNDLIDVAGKKGIGLPVLEKAGLVVKNEKGKTYNRFRNRLMFPIFSEGGRCIAFGGRTLGKEQAKYLNSPETAIYHKGRTLYGLNFAKAALRQHNHVVMVEGYTDFLRVFASGTENVVASSGTAFTEEQARVLKRYVPAAVIVYDADAAGQEATLRGLDILVEAGLDVKMVTLEAGKDPDEYIREKGGEAFKSALKQAEDIIDYKARLFSSRLDLATAEGKARLVHGIIDTIAKINDRIKRNLLIKEVAEKFGLAETDISREIQRRNIAGPPQGPAIRTTPEPVAIPRVELDILKLALLSESRIDQLKEQVSPKEFSHPACQELAEVMYQKRKKKEKIDFALLVQEMDPELKGQLLTRMFIDEEQTDVNRMLLDSITRMKTNRIEKEIRKVQEELHQMQQAGRSDRVASLFERVNALMYEKKRIRQA